MTRRRRLTLVAMCVAQGMTLLDVTIVNTALPSIQRELHMSAGQLEWVISAYALSLAAFIPLGGALGDRYGRKRFFLAGMIVFTVGSVACALSTSDVALIGSRALQGAGGAFMSALTLAILTETYPVERRAGAFGVWAAISGLGFGLGPVVGGALLSVFSWSSVFWVNVPIAVVGFVIALVAVAESRNPEARQLDTVGMGAIALGLLGITFGLIESSSHAWASFDVVVPLVLGVVLVVFFVMWEGRTSSPMLPPSLLRAHSFVSGCGVYLLTYLALAGVMFYVTLLFQDVEGWSPFRTGVSWLSMNIPFIVTAQCAGRLRRRFQPVVIVVGGCLVGAAGVAVLALLSGTTSFAVAFVGYVLVGIGWGTLVPGVVNVAMRDVPPGVSGGRLRPRQRGPAGRHLGRPRRARDHRGPCRHHRLGQPHGRGGGGRRAEPVRGRRSDRPGVPGPRSPVPARCGGRLRVGLPPCAARRRRFDAHGGRRGRRRPALRGRRWRRRSPSACPRLRSKAWSSGDRSDCGSGSRSVLVSAPSPRAAERAGCRRRRRR